MEEDHELDPDSNPNLTKDADKSNDKDNRNEAERLNASSNYAKDKKGSIHSISDVSSGQSESKRKQSISALPENATICQRLLHRDRLLTILTILSFLLGLGFGFWLKLTNPPKYWSRRRIMYLQFPGELFFRSLIAMKVPVAVSSVIAAVGSVNLRICRYVLLLGMLCNLGMIFLGASIGGLVTIPLHNKRAGVVNSQLGHSHAQNYCLPHNQSGNEVELCNFPKLTGGIVVDPQCTTDIEVFMNLWRALFPPNFIQAVREQLIVATDVTYPVELIPGTSTFSSCIEYLYRRRTEKTKKTLQDFNLAKIWVNNTNVVGLLAMSLVIGLCTIWTGDSARDFLNFFISLSEITLKMSSWVLWMAPLGICFLTAGNVVSNVNPLTFPKSLWMFMLCTLMGLLFQTFIILPGLYWVLLKKPPFKLYLSLAPSMGVSFGSSDSSSSIPIAIKSLEEVAQLDPRVVRILVPVMANTNLSGNALFLTSAMNYICISHDYNVNFGNGIYIIMVCVLITIVAPNTQADHGILELPLILTFSSLDGDMAKDMIPTLWMLNRAAAAANIANSCVGVAIVNHWSRKKLYKLTKELDEVEKEMELQEKMQQNNQVHETEPAKNEITL